jgi:RNA polymerase sigma-70 factor (ECF subfamily)
VASAGRRHSPESRDALAALCETYWFPLYAFVRRQGYSADDAQDLIQSFSARLLERNDLEVADRRRGRFRSYLLGALKHFLANQRKRSRAQKRGGGRAILSLDFGRAERRYHLEPADQLTPERLYEKRWALALLDGVVQRLAEEQEAAGKQALFEDLKECLTGREMAASYGEIAARLAMTEGAVKVAAHRLRRRYRALLQEEIAQTVAGPEEFEDEVSLLLAALAAENR